MKLLQSFTDRPQAEIVASLLKANGINSQITADDQGGMRPALATTLGVKLFVMAADFERATAVLKSAEG